MTARELLDPILHDNLASDKNGAMATLQLLRTAVMLGMGCFIAMAIAIAVVWAAIVDKSVLHWRGHCGFAKA